MTGRQHSDAEPAHTVASGTRDTASDTIGIDPYAATARETTEGRVYTVTGGDWDSLLDDWRHDERIVVNMGPVWWPMSSPQWPRSTR